MRFGCGVGLRFLRDGRFFFWRDDALTQFPEPIWQFAGLDRRIFSHSFDGFLEARRRRADGFLDQGAPVFYFCRPGFYRQGNLDTFCLRLLKIA